MHAADLGWIIPLGLVGYVAMGFLTLIFAAAFLEAEPDGEESIAVIFLWPLEWALGAIVGVLAGPVFLAMYFGKQGEKLSDNIRAAKKARKNSEPVELNIPAEPAAPAIRDWSH